MLRESGPDNSNRISVRFAGFFRPWVDDIAGGLRFFTRLPVPRLTESDTPETIPDFATAARALPLVGVVAAVPAATVILALSLTDLPAFLIAAVAVAVSLSTTGAFHEDGLADVADGFGGGHSVDRKLEIMRDSSIGTYGAAALFVSLAARIGALAALIDAGGGGIAAAIVVTAGGLSRTFVGWLWHVLPPARRDGNSTAAGRPARHAVLTASALSVALIIVSIIAVGVTSTIVALLLSGLATAGFGVLAKRQIGGQTGDVLGAAQQIAELAFLLGLLI